jgi:hypothetical protein
METVQALADTITRPIESFLASFDIQPSAYGFMFPPEIEAAKITQMVNDGVFPTVAGLAPALTCAILLIIARYIFQNIIFKVIFIAHCIFILR